MKTKLMFLALAAIGLAGCNGGFKKGDGGLQYKIVKDEGGPSIKEGDFFSINYIVKTDADSVMASSYEAGRPWPQIMAKPQSKGDIMSAIMLLSEGDSAIIKTDIDSASHGQKRNPALKGKYIVYTIKVEKVIPKGNLTPDVFKARYEDYMKKLSDADKNAEAGKIKKYIDDNNLKLTKTVTGLSYVINTPGAGALPAPGDTVVLNYLGKFVNGKVFDTNIKAEAIKGKLQINPMNPYKPIRFPVGAQGMIQGFNEGLLLMNKGAKATFIIPSSLAYGEQGNGPVGPFTPLVFDIELVDIVHPNPNAPKPVAVPPVQQPVKR